MKLLDTTFLIDLLRGKKETSALIHGDEPLLTTQINMYEVIRGFFMNKTVPSKIPRVLELFENIRVLPLDDNSIIKSAEISSDLISFGQEVHDTDCLIAGIAVSNGISRIVTKNSKHFERIHGLTIEGY